MSYDSESQTDSRVVKITTPERAIRDLMRSVQTTAFTAYRVHERALDVYQVFARHSYKDQDGQPKTTYLCIVLERIADRWTMTQVDSSQYPIRS